MVPGTGSAGVGCRQGGPVMKRRKALKFLAATALGFSWSKGSMAADQKPSRRILFFSRSVLFEHSVIKRIGDELSFAEKILCDLGKKAGIEVECTKGGAAFSGDLEKYDAFVSYSCGNPEHLAKTDSLDHSPPLTSKGRERLLQAVSAGKGFVAIHPGILMLPEAVGGDCIGHGSQQSATMRVTSAAFPGLAAAGSSFSLMEEWFSLNKFAKDIHVIMVQDCHGMDTKGKADKKCYDRPPFPATWCRMHGKGRIFYTSMGHREDVWTNQLFQQILMGGLSWALGDVTATIPPNLEQVAPEAEKTGISPG